MPFNEAFGWIWITLGFASGALLGLGFHAKDFLGGYSCWQRRLLRLGHIAFFGTGLLNILFAHSRARVELADPWLSVAAWCFVIGAIAMPTCCVIAARSADHKKKAGVLFVVPVASLTTAGVLTSIGLILHELNRGVGSLASSGGAGLGAGGGGGGMGGVGLGVLMGTVLGGVTLTGGSL